LSGELGGDLWEGGVDFLFLFLVEVLEYRCEGVGIYLDGYLVVENLLVIVLF
jgi:hypothetical protein